MQALRRLFVRISWPHTELSAAEEVRILEPLSLVTGLKTFEVNLPPVRGKEPDLSEDAAFQIIRRYQ